MKITITKFFKGKIYPVSFAILVLAGIFSAMPAYSQVDYTYGLNKKGFRIDLGAGAAVLRSNWSSNPISPSGNLGLDYDLSQYFTIGLDSQFGTLEGEDVANHLYFTKTNVTFFSGSLMFKVAVGQFADFHSRNGFQDAMKRLYLGVGIGGVYSNVSALPHSDGKGLANYKEPGFADGVLMQDLRQKNNSPYYTGNAAYAQVPINFGTNIALRGFLGNDKVELNPNLQYNIVLSPTFDGYEPNKTDYPGNPASGSTQAYFVTSLTLRYKF